MAYVLSTTAGVITSAEIVARLDASVPVQLAHIKAIASLERNGCRYSNQDFDVLAAARRAIGQMEPSEFQRGWVAAMTKAA